jgi:hypothetical protein
MTQEEYERKRYFVRLVFPVFKMEFRFKGCTHWWTEYFDSSQYCNKSGSFRAALSPFCEMRELQPILEEGGQK